MATFMFLVTPLRGLITRTAVMMCLFSTLGSLSPCPSLAGSGRVRVETGVKRLDFEVHVAFEATPQQLTTIEEGLLAANTVLFDATDGQFSLGNICIKNNSECGEDAEICILPGNGRSKATHDGYGVASGHVTTYVGCFDDPYTAAHMLAHEFGHLVWGVFDEYEDINPWTYCAHDTLILNADLSFCLMDRFHTYGGMANGGGEITMNEFCTSTNHDPNGDTPQSKRNNKMSCWATIGNHPTRGGYQPAGGEPIQTAGVPPTAQIVTAGAAPWPVGIVYDVGPTVGFDYLAIQAATQQLLQLLPLESIRLLLPVGKGDQECEGGNFCRDGSVYTFSLESEGERQALILSVDHELCEPRCVCRRDLADWLLETAGATIDAGINSDCGIHLVLITDGNDFASCGADEGEAIAWLIDAGIRVHAVAVGADADDERLRMLADTTGGTFYATDAASLPALMVTIAARLEGEGLVASGPGAGPAVRGIVHGVRTAVVDSGLARARFLFTWPELSRNPPLQLVTPSATVLDENYSGTGLAIHRGPGYAIFEVAPPLLEVGAWQMVVGADSLGTPVVEGWLATATRGFTLALLPRRPDYAAGDTIEVSTVPQYRGVPLLGVTVAGSVTAPDGNLKAVQFLDDGDTSASGDYAAGDGIYSARVHATQGGAHLMRITAAAETSTTAPGESLDGQPETPVVTGPFARSRMISVHARGTTTADVPPHTQVIGSLAVYPTPTRPSTPLRIRFRLARSGVVRLKLFDVAGRKLADRSLGWQPAGTHQREWTPSSTAGTHLAPGIYSLQLVSPDAVQVARVIIAP